MMYRTVRLLVDLIELSIRSWLIKSKSYSSQLPEFRAPALSRVDCRPESRQFGYAVFGF